ncbi:Ankyrin repeat domain-containing protein 56 [Trachymyrmex septentrionalis]|uniref:Ankyrin repeat domain-containing protein 56 n=1 Tax=Trachymyrmex septentrionalis TaxID=34720 RepID=A0A195FQI4_9HYME|nr:Ankyrin repeat domain-containing protein 56 [Trachymyrmex septentrionalis]
MATPSELSLEEIRNYLLENGGTARNHDLVKHFKRFLTDPETRVEARNRFKEYVNTLATIKNEEGEKYLVLKKKYRQPFLDLSPPKQVGSPLATSNLTTPVSPLREPPPYRPPPPAPLSPSSSNSHVSLEESATPISTREKNDDSEPSSSMSPPVPPRRKSQDKLKVENKENVDRNRNSSLEAVIKEDEAVTTTNSSSAEQLSVRERMQRFNRMASETDLHVRHNDTTVPVRKRTDKSMCVFGPSLGRRRFLHLDFLARNHALESWRSSCCNIARQLMFSKHMQEHKGFRVPY